MNIKALSIAVMLIAVGSKLHAQEVDSSHDYVSSQLPRHAAVVDSQGKLIAWYEPGQKPWL